MREELANLKASVENAKAAKSAKKGKKGGKKGKKGKKGGKKGAKKGGKKGKSKDSAGDASPEVLFEELARANIIKRVPDISLGAFLGEFGSVLVLVFFLG
jgi:hypothetical protein